MIDERNMKPNTAYMKDDDGNVYEVEADICLIVGEPINEPQHAYKGVKRNCEECCYRGNSGFCINCNGAPHWAE